MKQHTSAKKICIIINELYLGGAQRLVVDDVEELQRRGIDVSLITLQSHAGRMTFEHLCNLPAGKRHEILFGSLFDVFALLRLISHLRRERYDVIITHLWLANTVGRVVALFVRVPIVLSFEQNVYDTVKSWKQFMIDRWLERCATKIIAVSGAVRESLVRHGIHADRIAVVPNAIRTEDFQHPVDRALIRSELDLVDDAFLFLTIGRLERQKAHDTLLYAFKNVTNGYLLVVGEGELGAALGETIVSLGLEGRVFLLGARADIPALLGSVDCFVFPSRFEGVPVSMLEALATGLPVITTDFLSVREIITHESDGLIVPVDDISQLTKSMQEVLTANALRDSLSKQALVTARRFSIKKHIDHVLSIISAASSRAVSVITFANLGKKKNLKTPDILPVIDAFERAGNLKQVICQIQCGFQFRHTVSAIPVPLRYGIRVLEKFFSVSFSRRTIERLFDFFAQWKLESAGVFVFHGGYFLPHTLRRAHQKGAVAIDMAVAAHPMVNAALEKEELTLLGFPDFQGFYMRLEKECKHVQEFDYVIALSDLVKESYIQSGFPAERIFVAHPDIDIHRFAPTDTPRTKKDIVRFLYMAHTQPLKGLHYLLEAWKNLTLPEAELLVVGGFSNMPHGLEKRYRDAITQHPNIRWLPGTETPEAQYRDASVFVFPSITEGFGRVTLEAMASRLPVITTANAKGIIEDGKTGFVVPIRDAAALAEKISFLYHHREVRDRMGRDARKAVEDKKPFGKAAFEIYREVLQREHTI